MALELGTHPKSTQIADALVYVGGRGGGLLRGVEFFNCLAFDERMTEVQEQQLETRLTKLCQMD